MRASARSFACAQTARAYAPATGWQVTATLVTSVVAMPLPLLTAQDAEVGCVAIVTA